MINAAYDHCFVIIALFLVSFRRICHKARGCKQKHTNITLPACISKVVDEKIILWSVTNKDPDNWEPWETFSIFFALHIKTYRFSDFLMLSKETRSPLLNICENLIIKVTPCEEAERTTRLIVRENVTFHWTKLHMMPSLEIFIKLLARDGFCAIGRAKWSNLRWRCPTDCSRMNVTLLLLRHEHLSAFIFLSSTLFPFSRHSFSYSFFPFFSCSPCEFNA